MIIKVVAFIIAVSYVSINLALCGGFLDFRYNNAFSNNISDEYLTAYFASHEIASGVSPSAALHFVGKSQLGESIPTSTSNTVNFTANDAYYSRLGSLIFYESGMKGQDAINHSLSVDALVIMPKKFTAIHGEVVNLTEDAKYAEINIKFTYDNQVYEFINQSDLSNGVNSLTLILQPFCDEFEGLDLDTDETFSDSFSDNGFDYEGSLTIQALQNQGDAQ